MPHRHSIVLCDDLLLVESKIGVGMLGQMTPYFTVSSANLFMSSCQLFWYSVNKT